MRRGEGPEGQYRGEREGRRAYIPFISDMQTTFRDPSTARAALTKRERRKKRAAPVGMTSGNVTPRWSGVSGDRAGFA